MVRARRLLVLALVRRASAQRCLSWARLRMDLGFALDVALSEDATADGGMVVDLVRDHGITAGGGCEDGACVAGVLLDHVRHSMF